MNDRVSPQLLLFLGLDELDYWGRAALRYAVNDYLWVEIGADVFQGKSISAFGQFDKSDRVFFEIACSFEL